MKQLTQKLKSGEMTVQDVPLPFRGPGMVLVRNHFSVISAGTEGSTVATARKSLLDKARERPDQAKQALQTLMAKGPVETYRAVTKRLEAYSPLGYSCAGRVIDTERGMSERSGDPATAGRNMQQAASEQTFDVQRTSDFSVGDLVACAGVGYANHAEIVAVPENLCVKLAPDADLRGAAYNTLGAIALQGVRQADLQLGESCCVIGLGLVGQLTCLLLKASGVRVVGMDVSEWAVRMAAQHAADAAHTRDAGGLARRLAEFGGGAGVDAVIIAAGTDSLDPINLAGAIARRKGRVVVVGGVPTGFEREDYYRKELELRMSCSYGPGRYDPAYEEKGIDYPYAYVRWTENRNMQAFQELLQSRKIDIGYLTTHEFALDDAPGAYDMILAKSEPYMGILVKYDTVRDLDRKPIPVTRVPAAGKVGLAFIGAGSYAQSHLLPNLPRDSDVVRKAVMTATGATSKRVAERFGFGVCTSEESDIFDNPDINTVFIATRHDTHAEYAIKALRAGKHVFCEKPLAITEAQLAEIASAYHSARPSSIVHLPLLMVGFNRRFAPLARELKERIGGGPVAMTYRVNAGRLPADSWIHDPEIGGGRIIGEVCHFVDFLTFMCGALPVRVQASALDAAPAECARPSPPDTVSVNIEFENGSVGSIAYFADGAESVGKERIEVHGAGMTGIIHDFKTLELHTGRRVKRSRLLVQDKGQKDMVREFVRRVKQGGEPLIPFEEIEVVTCATFKILESVRARSVVAVAR